MQLLVQGEGWRGKDTGELVLMVQETNRRSVIHLQVIMLLHLHRKKFVTCRLGGTCHG